VTVGPQQDALDAATSAAGGDWVVGDIRSVVVDERVVVRECAGCGREFRPARRGRPARYCSAACRQRGWALRQAERALGTSTDRRPTVVREVVERVLQPERVAPVAGPAISDDAASRSVPQCAREWVQLLEQLAVQLGDESSPVAREHWHHRRLHDQLSRMHVLLAAAHPGGLERLSRHR
jgi:hypothetical protein